MPKKKLQKKRIGKTSKVKKTSGVLQKRLNNTTRIIQIEKKIHIVIKNLVLFGILFILSLGLYNLSGADKILLNFFGILALIMGVITLSFIITYFVFFFLKSFKK